MPDVTVYWERIVPDIKTEKIFMVSVTKYAFGRFYEAYEHIHRAWEEEKEQTRDYRKS